MKLNKREKGFSLIELLIVVAIILIIAAIAIPNLMRARIAANQSSAAASLRTIGSAAVMYQTTYGDGYPPSLTVMGPVTVAGASPDCFTAGLLDGVLAPATGASIKSGYTFVWNVGNVVVPTPPGTCAAGYVDMFSATATPVGLSQGTASYCNDASNVIRQQLPATGALVPVVITTTPAGGCDTTVTSPLGN